MGHAVSVFIIAYFSRIQGKLLIKIGAGLWSRDKATKGTADVASGEAGRIDVAIIEVEVVGAVSIRVGSRGPVITALASDAKLISGARMDTAAPHKEERT